jgi:hypothetical protein
MNPLLFALVACVACIFGFTAGHIIGRDVSLHEMRADAVKHGCASYDPQTGKWGWKPSNEAKP